MKIVFAILAVLALAGVMGYFLLYKGTSSQPAVEVATPEATATPSSQGDELSAVKEIVVSAKEYSFTPATMTIKAGEKVKLTFQNNGKMQHDWVLEDMDINTNLVNPRGEETVEFTINEPGEYAFYCSVPGHRALGMVGKLVVE